MCFSEYDLSNPHTNSQGYNSITTNQPELKPTIRFDVAKKYCAAPIPSRACLKMKRLSQLNVVSNRWIQAQSSFVLFNVMNSTYISKVIL